MKKVLVIVMILKEFCEKRKPLNGIHRRCEREVYPTGLQVERQKKAGVQLPSPKEQTITEGYFFIISESLGSIIKVFYFFYFLVTFFANNRHNKQYQKET
jgi:hypothetical protein